MPFTCRSMSKILIGKILIHKIWINLWQREEEEKFSSFLMTFSFKYQNWNKQAMKSIKFQISDLICAVWKKFFRLWESNFGFFLQNLTCNSLTAFPPYYSLCKASSTQWPWKHERNSFSPTKLSIFSHIHLFIITPDISFEISCIML